MRGISRYAKLAVFALACSALPDAGQAISENKLRNLCLEVLGLRVAETPRDKDGAGFGLDNGTDPKTCQEQSPEDWDNLLNGTIDLIKGRENSGAGHLMIASQCHGTARETEGAFPVCAKVRGGVVAATPQTIRHYSADELVQWVIENLP